MQDTFQWTDELVQEFVQFTLHQSPAFQGRYTDMEQFKSSKSPKKEWEVVAYQEMFTKSVVASPSCVEWSAAEKGHKNYTIHSVRRLSDSSEWQIKETVEVWETGRFTIQSFEIAAGKMMVKTDGGTYLLNALIKLPQPILTTVDGFELFEDRDVIVVYLKDHSYSIGPLSGFHPDILDNNKVFVYDYNAQQYIFENKPLLSLNNVKEVCDVPGMRVSAQTDILIEKLTALVKQKLNQ